MKASTRARRVKLVGRLPSSVAVLLLVLFVILPIMVVFFNAFKSSPEFGRDPLGPPTVFHTQNLVDAWERGQFGRAMLVTGAVVAATVILRLVVAGLAAYALARLRVPGSEYILMFMLAISTIPSWMYIVSQLIIWREVGLMNTLPGVVLIHLVQGLPFSTFLLRSFLLSLPPDFEDAARIDGAGELQVLVKVLVPMTWPGFLTVGLLTAMAIWNSFYTELIFLSGKPELWPVGFSFYAFQGRYTTNWPLTSAGALITILPIVSIFLLMQRRFIEGLTQGGLKM